MGPMLAGPHSGREKECGLDQNCFYTDGNLVRNAHFTPKRSSVRVRYHPHGEAQTPSFKLQAVGNDSRSLTTR